jgi:hypothetical protein
MLNPEFRYKAAKPLFCYNLPDRELFKAVAWGDPPASGFIHRNEHGYTYGLF